jgi:hypothetical protein
MRRKLFNITAVLSLLLLLATAALWVDSIMDSIDENGNPS